MENLKFEVIKETTPGEKFKQLFEKNWPAYRAWYLDEGEAARPTYLECVTALKKYMPELFPVYEQMLALLDADDIKSRFLSLYRPPPFYSGCSQLILKGEEDALIRNYDFPPMLCEGTIMHSQWLGKSVIAMSDCVWGALDGINDSGLAVSIAYGGRFVQGDGFGITIVLRYVLETCGTVEEAIKAFKRIPVHLDYNIALLDKTGEHATLFIAPDRDLCVSDATTSTNHQDADGQETLFLADSKTRLNALNQIGLYYQQSIQEITVQFLLPPIYRPHQTYQSGTLYTAAYLPKEGKVNYLWPTHSLTLSFDEFTEQEVHIFYPAA
ncbi:MAG: C45 family peptidase [Psychromonas sp.]